MCISPNSPIMKMACDASNALRQLSAYIPHYHRVLSPQGCIVTAVCTRWDRYRLGLAIEGCAEAELCRGPEQKHTAVSKFREAHAAFAAALALAEGKDKTSRASMSRVEKRLRELGATVQADENAT